MNNPYESDDVNLRYLKDVENTLNNRGSLEYSRKNQVEDITFDNMINVDIDDYTLEDILNLLDIKITDDTHYEKLYEELRAKIDKNIEVFEKLNNKEIVEFFKNIKSSLLGNEVKNNITESEKLLKIFSNENEKIGTSNGEEKSTKSKMKTNQIDRQNVSKLLTVDSRFRSNTDELSTDYSIDLNYHIKNVIEMKLSDLEFPTTYYPIDDDYENNYFLRRYKVLVWISFFMFIFLKEIIVKMKI